MAVSRGATYVPVACMWADELLSAGNRAPLLRMFYRVGLGGAPPGSRCANLDGCPCRVLGILSGLAHEQAVLPCWSSPVAT